MGLSMYPNSGFNAANLMNFTPAPPAVPQGLNFGMGQQDTFSMAAPAAYSVGAAAPVSVPVPVAPGPALSTNTPVVPQAQKAAGATAAATDAAKGPGFWNRLESLGGLEGVANLTQGLASLGQLFAYKQQMDLAKKQQRFTEAAYKDNYRNQVTDYNTSLEAKMRSQMATEGRSDELAGYLAQHQLR